jgi:hypothetical protein
VLDGEEIGFDNLSPWETPNHYSNQSGITKSKNNGIKQSNESKRNVVNLFLEKIRKTHHSLNRNEENDCCNEEKE